MTTVQASASVAATVPFRPRAAGAGTIAKALGTLGLGLSSVARAAHLDFWLGEVDPTWSVSEVRARVVDIVDETEDVKTFVLAPNAKWSGHRAGQFVTVEVEVDGVRLARCYSLSSAPGARRLAITVKRVPGGRVSTWMHERVRRGDVLRLGAAQGEFVQTSPRPEKLLLLSGGSGITPLMSILRDLARDGAVGDVVFAHAARSSRDVVFRRELDALAAQHAGLRLAVFREDVEGRLDPAKLRAAVPDLATRSSMLCGPPGMMSALVPAWSEAGLEHRLQTERFTPAPSIAPPAGDAPEAVKLTLLRAGRSVTTEGGGTLLEQLERGGERPAHGCRMGICNTCRCTKKSGVVEDVRTGALSTEPDDEIRLCVSRARTDIELAL